MFKRVPRQNDENKNICPHTNRRFVSKVSIGLFSFLFLLLFNAICQQANNYVIRHYTSDNGLPQNSVHQILFDKEGYCWLRTQAGLVRFDNRQFNTFSFDNIHGLKNQRIIVLNTDKSGVLYAQNMSRQNLLIAPTALLSSTIPLLQKNNAAGYESAEQAYFNTNNQISHAWDLLKKQMKDPGAALRFSLKNDEIYCIYDSSLYFINTQAWLLEHFPEPPLSNTVLGDDYFIQVWAHNRIKLWKHSRLQAASKIEGDIVSDASFLSGQFTLLWCPTGTFIFSGDKLYRIEIENGHVRSIRVLSGINIKAVVCIYYNVEEDSYYIGSDLDGLYIIKPSPFYSPPLPKNTMPVFYALAKTKDDKIIARNTIFLRNGKAYNLPMQSQTNKAAYVDSADRMYYANVNTLSILDVSKNKIEKVISLDDMLVTLMPGPGGGELLACTVSSLFLLSANNTILWKKELPLINNVAYGLFAQGGDNYLLTTNAGLKWYNLATNRFEKSLLDSFSIRTVYSQKPDRLWISTDGNGAYLYQKSHLYSLPLGPSKALKSIHSFIDDGRGNFWLPTNNGLYKVAIDSLADYTTGKTHNIHFYTFNNTDGLPANEFNGGCIPSYLWLKDSTLVLPSMNGIVEFKPFQLHVQKPENKIYIDEILLDSNIISADNYDKEIDLPPDFNSLNIRISSPYFESITNLRLEYAIDNGKAIWQPVPATGDINLNTLPPGTYKLVVRNLISGNANELVLHIKVLPPYSQTWWFYLTLAIVFCLAMFLFLQYRIRYLQKKKQKIEDLVTLRTTELNKTIEQLATSQDALEQSNVVKEQIITMITHDLRSPVRFLNTISRHLEKNHTSYDSDTQRKYLSSINSSVRSLWIFIEQFFTWAMSQREGFKVKREKISLPEIFDDIAKLYADILLHNHNTLNILHTDITCFSDKHILSLILRNLIDNASKNTQNGTVTLSANIDNNALIISIKDTGRGLTQEQIDMFIDISKGRNAGMGSNIILNMLQRINGSLSIVSEIGTGSNFTVILNESFPNYNK